MMDPEYTPAAEMNEQTVEQADPMLSLLEETRAGNELLHKQLRITRWIAVFLAVLVLVLGACGLWAVTTVNETLGQVDFAALSEKLSNLDIDGLNQAVNSLEKQVGLLDIPGINEALSEIGGAAEGIESTMESFGTLLDKLAHPFGR